jgi:hypothetical protein
MTNHEIVAHRTAPIGWLLAGVLTVTIVFNGIALALN